MRKIKLISLAICLMASFSSSVFAMDGSKSRKDIAKEYYDACKNYKDNPNVYSLNSFVNKDNKGDNELKNNNLIIYKQDLADENGGPLSIPFKDLIKNLDEKIFKKGVKKGVKNPIYVLLYYIKAFEEGNRDDNILKTVTISEEFFNTDEARRIAHFRRFPNLLRIPKEDFKEGAANSYYRLIQYIKFLISSQNNKFKVYEKRNEDFQENEQDFESLDKYVDENNKGDNTAEKVLLRFKRTDLQDVKRNYVKDFDEQTICMNLDNFLSLEEDNFIHSATNYYYALKKYISKLRRNERDDNILKDTSITGYCFKDQQVREKIHLRKFPNALKLTKTAFVGEEENTTYILLQYIKYLIYNQKNLFNTLNIYNKNYESYQKSKNLNYFDAYVNEENKGDMHALDKNFQIPSREIKSEKAFKVENLQQFYSLDEKFFVDGSKTPIFMLKEYSKELEKGNRNDCLLKDFELPEKYLTVCKIKEYKSYRSMPALLTLSKYAFIGRDNNPIYKILQYIKYQIFTQKNNQNESLKFYEKKCWEYQNNQNFDSLNAYINKENRGNEIFKKAKIKIGKSDLADKTKDSIEVDDYKQLYPLTEKDFENGSENHIYKLIKYIQDFEKGNRNDNMLKSVDIPKNCFKNPNVTNYTYCRCIPAVLFYNEYAFAGRDKNTVYILLQIIKNLIFKQIIKVKTCEKRYNDFKNNQNCDSLNAYINEKNKGDKAFKDVKFRLGKMVISDKNKISVKMMDLQELLALNEEVFENGSKNPIFRLKEYIKDLEKGNRNDNVLKNLELPQNCFKNAEVRNYSFCRCFPSVLFCSENDFVGKEKNIAYILLQYMKYLIYTQIYTQKNKQNINLNNNNLNKQDANNQKIDLKNNNLIKQDAENQKLIKELAKNYKENTGSSIYENNDQSTINNTMKEEDEKKDDYEFGSFIDDYDDNNQSTINNSIKK